MKNIKVMIVEDDFMVAEINKNVTEEVQGFIVVKIAKDASEALHYIDSNPLDLIILDIYLPDINGIELLKIIRKKEHPVDFILITAAHDSKTIEQSMRFGVFDYIIKPFDFSRYKNSLINYKKFNYSIKQNEDYSQDKLDQMIPHSNMNNGKEDLPKGITNHTLGKIKSAVDSCGSAFIIDDIMEKLSFSRITVRRYLEFMVESSSMKKSCKYKKVGRPTIIYTKQT